MLPAEPLRLSAAEFVEWCGSRITESPPSNTRITVDSRRAGESFADVLPRIGLELSGGATKVVLFSRGDKAVCVYSIDNLPKRFSIGDDLVIRDALPGFSAPVHKFFE